jgi:hypothetical protein
VDGFIVGVAVWMCWLVGGLVDFRWWCSWVVADRSGWDALEWVVGGRKMILTKLAKMCRRGTFFGVILTKSDFSHTNVFSEKDF